MGTNFAILSRMNISTTGRAEPLLPRDQTQDERALPWDQWLTVTQLNEQIRDLLEETWPFVRLRGEISDLHQPASGHYYLTLLDAQSRIRAVIWRTTRQRLRMQPRAGETVLVTGRLAAYPPRGEYQFVIEGMQPGGSGTERERFLQLFARLKAEGLFDETRKRPLPWLPEVIGVVTSASGAAIHDITRVLDDRFPGYHLLLAPTRVQGEGAAAEIVAALQALVADGRAQVIICGRGGGSSEDLAAFNHEAVVRAIAASPIPIISAVGHEVDLTLADLAADRRAPTPSAAAEQVMPDKRVVQARVLAVRQRLQRASLARLTQQRSAVQLWQQRLLHPQRRLAFFRVRCDDLLQRLLSAERHWLEQRRQRVVHGRNRLSVWSGGAAMGLLRTRLDHAQQRLEQAGRLYLVQHRERLIRLEVRLHGVSPLAVLQRGYAIVYDQRGQVARNTATLQVGEGLRIQLAQGEVEGVIQRLQ
ncbi:MAG: exodeoxyribonuclease VII large subunit [Magnetococcales bacterium]|nr:exodeoxyribonuclease VII large subunit [Magnetococcales bacterium]